MRSKIWSANHIDMHMNLNAWVGTGGRGPYVLYGLLLEELHARVCAWQVNEDLVVEGLVHLVVPRTKVLFNEPSVLGPLPLQRLPTPRLIGRQVALQTPHRKGQR